ncbi:TetR/AcrR family transcriptional regulator (plasmid) [Methylobacterium sp. NMS12]|uniref:TetR family transcriptional regulator n=1 Tax=Methylobacterium sp. NMS12 TaxID=3079766 RepID=UPI003F883233
MPGSRPRGRPLSFDRDAALDRVLPVFWKKGFASASLDDLAAAAELNRPNLAAAFGDKRGLYLATIRQFRDKFVKDVGVALDGPGSLLENIDSFFELALKLYAKEGLGCFVFGTAPASAGDDVEIRRETAETLEIVQKSFEQRLRKSVADCPEALESVPGVATALSGILLMLALSSRAGVPTEELRGRYRAATRAILINSDCPNVQIGSTP